MSAALGSVSGRGGGGSWGYPGSRARGPVGGLVDNAFVIGFTSPSGGYRGPCVSGP